MSANGCSVSVGGNHHAASRHRHRRLSLARCLRQLRRIDTSFDDGDRFKWVQGVRGGLEVSLNGSGLPQFPEGPKNSHLGFAVEVAHWSASSFEATVIDLAVKLDAPVF